MSFSPNIAHVCDLGEDPEAPVFLYSPFNLFDNRSTAQKRCIDLRGESSGGDGGYGSGDTASERIQVGPETLCRTRTCSRRIYCYTDARYTLLLTPSRRRCRKKNKTPPPRCVDPILSTCGPTLKVILGHAHHEIQARPQTQAPRGPSPTSSSHPDKRDNWTGSSHQAQRSAELHRPPPSHQGEERR